jgi:hypothetical protein
MRLEQTMPGLARGDELSGEVRQALAERGVSATDEISLRHELERRLPAYTLYRLPPAAAKRWKCRYRLMFGDTYVDCQSVAEAYAMALLAMIPTSGQVGA